MTSHDKQKGIVRSVLICLIGILRITYTVSQRGLLRLRQRPARGEHAGHGPPVHRAETGRVGVVLL